VANSRILKSVAIIIGLFAVLTDRFAFAEEIPRGVTVQSRAKPELDPLGIKPGSFLFFPELIISNSYNDNIMSSDGGEISDNIVELALKGSLETDWSTHSLKAAVETKILKYIDNPDENYQDYTLTADGRFDVSSDFKLTGGGNALFGHESRSSTDDVGGFEPTVYRKFTLNGGADKEFGKFSAKGGFVIDKFDYDDANSSVGNINNDDRDRLEAVANFRTGFEFNPETEAFVRLEINDKNYRVPLDDTGVNRDSSGFEATSGLSFDLTGITFGNVFAGYRMQSFNDQSLKSAKGPTAGLDLTWNASTITTLKGTIERTVEETTTAGASGIFRTKSSLSIDHELLRNVVLSAKAQYTHNDFVGIGRKDKEPQLDIGVDYKLFRNLYSKFDYTYSARNSSVANSDFRQHVFKLQFSVQL